MFGAFVDGLSVGRALPDHHPLRGRTSCSHFLSVDGKRSAWKSSAHERSGDGGGGRDDGDDDVDDLV